MTGSRGAECWAGSQGSWMVTQHTDHHGRPNCVNFRVLDALSALASLTAAGLPRRCKEIFGNLPGVNIATGDQVRCPQCPQGWVLVSYQARVLDACNPCLALLRLRPAER